MLQEDKLLNKLYKLSPIKLPLKQPKATCIYIPGFYPHDLLQQLDLEIAWRQDSMKIFGKTNPLPRKTAFYGDAGTSYRYSGILNVPEEWTPALDSIRCYLSESLEEAFNAVLVNRYSDGSQHMGYHADDEPELGSNPTIASLSFGATRRFLIRSCDGSERHGLDLEDRSLLIMSGSFQHHYRHALAKTKRNAALRINLTFRKII